MSLFQKAESSENIFQMEMVCERKTAFQKGRSCGRQINIFMFLGTICMIFLMVMISVIFSNQEKKLKDTERLLDSLKSSVSYLQSDQQTKQRDFECQQNVSYVEVKSLMVSLSSSVSALTSKLNDAVSSQEQKLTETGRLLDSLKSSISSLQSDQQNKQWEFESVVSSLSNVKSSVSNLTSSVNTLSSKQQSPECQQDVSYTEVKSLMVNLSNSVSALTSKLNDAVSKQEQKLTDTERLLDSFKSSVNSLQSDQQNNQRDFDGRVMNALNDLKTKMCAKTTDLPESNCKSGWIPYLSSCYLFSRDKLNWSMARDYCEQQGALLLKIEDDDDEWTFVTNITIPDHYWVGLTDQNTGQWRWADDTPYTMNKDRWNPEQPDDWTEHGLEGGEDCGQFTYTGKLNDNHCSVKMKYICKVQSRT
ncbi:asialoglycoprotein receptor 1-like [Xyrauchen texanus]|uniref:asialoglycoprotein receptor 1-like n=1 Tax=Xyrauchen texanus TaxID=154827 RepID=UPI0022420D93|nr:asialoglycoprotein receptor 1-like [Xyrauchen texanus]